jgi:hypothetical protein
MNDPHDAGQAWPGGRCATCRHATIVRSDRGSGFLFCERSRTDAAYARYPPLPVRACAGHEAAPGASSGPAPPKVG